MKKERLILKDPSGLDCVRPNFSWGRGRFLVALLICALPAMALKAPAAEKVSLVRAPNGGIQPQVAVDENGVVHLIYFRGEARGGDLCYVRRDPGEPHFSEPIQVNSRPGSAIAAGSIRGAQLAVGREGQVHVAWNGHPPEGGNHRQAPMLYTRLVGSGFTASFEPERDLITFARGLDGGGSVAADNLGNVYVMWHAPKPGGPEGEAGRTVFVARSKDDGKSFAPEEAAVEVPTGACACCGMKGYADNDGNVFILYRGAFEQVHRDQILLASRNKGQDFELVNKHPWELSSCPMSSAFLTAGKEGILAAWETAGEVHFSTVDPETLAVSEPATPEGSGKRKHPVAVSNSEGNILLVWVEGTGWAKGGSLAWQLFDPSGQPLPEKGQADGVPVWSFATAFAEADGSFVVVY